MSFLLALKGLPWKLIGVLVFIMVVFVVGTKYSANKAKAANDEAALALASKTAKITAAQTSDTGDIRASYAGQVQAIAASGEELHREVPLYVTSKSNISCTVNTGAVRVLNNAASSTAAPLPLAPTGIDDPAPGVTLASLTDNVAGNYNECRAIASRLRMLQDWNTRMSQDSEQK